MNWLDDVPLALALGYVELTESGWFVAHRIYVLELELGLRAGPLERDDSKDR